MTTGECIRKIRHEKKMTQKQLAERCGVADSAIRKYESGKIQPKLATIRKIAGALGVPWSLLTGDNVDPADRFLLEFTDKLNESVDDMGAKGSILHFLRIIYGDVRPLIAKCDTDEREFLFYSIGRGEQKFFLSPKDISTLTKFVELTLPLIVDQIKYTGTKEQFAETHIVSQIVQEKNDETDISALMTKSAVKILGLDLKEGVTHGDDPETR